MIGISSNIILYLKFYNILFKNNIGLDLRIEGLRNDRIIPIYGGDKRI